MYRLATILLIGSAAALRLHKHDQDLAQVKAAECHFDEEEGALVGCEDEPAVFCWENEDGEEECEEEGLGL